MNKLAEEFRELLALYVKLTTDLTSIAGSGVSGSANSEEDSQTLVQSILENRNCLTEIQQLNERLKRLFGKWKETEANYSSSESDEIQGIVDDVGKQMRLLEKICDFGTQKVEERRKQLTEELANVGKGSRYLKMINPIQENHPKFIDSAC